MKKIDTDVSNLKQGLQPQNLSFWYDKIIKETIDLFGILKVTLLTASNPPN